MAQTPIAAAAIAALTGTSIYPAPFAERVAGRTKRKLGEHFGLSNFGVNLTELRPGSVSALKHCHSRQDEFVYVLEGTATLILGPDTFELGPGDCCGFTAGTGLAHQVSNCSTHAVVYLEIGDRSAGDQAEFPDDDLKATMLADGVWKLTHKDGSEY